jgi:hypothetical protein
MLMTLQKKKVLHKNPTVDNYKDHQTSNRHFEIISQPIYARNDYFVILVGSDDPSSLFNSLSLPFLLLSLSFSGKCCEILDSI